MAYRKVGAFWLKEGKNGKFMSGEINEAIPAGARLFCFKNTYKNADNQPDYTLNMADDEPAPVKPPAAPKPPAAEDCPF